MSNDMAQSNGFSLFECIFTMMIIAVMASMALPLIQPWLTKSSVDKVTQDIEYAVRYARNLAVVQDYVYLLTPLVDNNWSHGLQLMLEEDKTVLIKHKPLQIWKWDLPALEVTWFGFEHQTKIRFSKALHHARSNGRFWVRSGHVCQKIVLNRFARIIEKVKRTC